MAGVVPGIERQPRKKLEPSPERLLAVLHRWRDEAVRAGKEVTRIALAFEAGREKRRTSRRQVNDSRRRVRKPSSKITIKVPLCVGCVHVLLAISGAIGSMLTGPEGRRRAIVRAASASVGNGTASFFSPQATVGNLRVSQTECPPG